MSVSVEFLPGPLTTEMVRTSAETALRQHPAIQKGAAYALEQLEGRWVAAVVHTAGPPPFGGGGPADVDESAPSLKSEGPDDMEPSEGEEPKLDGGGEEGDSEGESKPHDKGGEKGELHQVVEMLHQIAEALGLPIGLGESPVPGAEGPDVPVPPPAGPPHGPGGPAGPASPPGADVQKVIHNRVTKPGETPPGGTPVGAPAFASVRNDHPWAHLAGKVASFEVADKIGNAPLNEIQDELHTLASEIKYRVARFREDHDSDGDRVAVAVITAH